MKEASEILNNILKAIIYLLIILLIIIYSDPIECREFNDKYINHKTETDVQKTI